MTSVELFVQGLRERGVEWMATLCGHGLDPLFQAAQAAGLRLVDTRNEQAASYMAEAYARLARRPGVCAVSSGVAHVNAMSGLCDAWFDGTPMLLISGAGALATAGLGHFQDLDQAALARPITKYARTIDCPERALEILDEAWQTALAPPVGPVHLTFPMDVQRADAARPVRPVPRPSLSATVEEADLATFERPLLVAGSGVWYAGESAALMEFAERHAIPVTTPIWDRGPAQRPSPVWMGVLGAASGGPALLPDADCVILAGAAPDYRVGFLQQETRVVRGWQGLRGEKNFAPWLAEAQRRKAEFRRAVESAGAEQARAGTHAIHIVEALRRVLPDAGVLLIDGGSIGQWAHQLLCSEQYPGHWLTCGRSGVVGWGLGGAMGARLAYPERAVVLLSGDGAFTFTVAELECAVRQKLPFVVIVADDQGWGITRTGHLRQFGEAIASSLGPLDFVRLAEALGARGVPATHPEQIAPALERALSERVVTVLHVPIVGGYPG